MHEILELRQENSKTFDLGAGKRQLESHIGATHYKDEYASDEPWKDIDLTWEGNKITKAPYELTLDGKKLTIRDKKSGEVSVIELTEIGGKPIKSLPDIAWEKSKGLARAPGITTLENVALDTDLEIVTENSAVRFTRVLKSDKAPKEARFRVTGNFRVMASDEDGKLPVESTLINGILTETLNPDRPVRYPARIDPTWQVGASTDDCNRRLSDDVWGIGAGANAQAGAYDATYYQYGSGMRFTAITILHMSTITQAYLTLRASASVASTVTKSRISAEDVDDAVTFADDKAAFDTRWAARTTARVDWDAIPAWTVNVDYNSPEIKTVIQEIIDRASWASGNDIVIFWEDFEDRSTHAEVNRKTAYCYDDSTTYCPKLVIVYTVPTISGTVTLTGSGVADAVIRCVNQTTGDVYTGASIAGGGYSVDIPVAGSYHTVVEYETGGLKYNAKSLWDVVIS